MLLKYVVLNYLQNIRTLPVMAYNNAHICYRDINAFNICAKNTNDINNKKRENIIGRIIAGINNPTDDINNYYKFSRRWNNIKDAVNNYINKELNIHKNINLIHRGGRKYNYDFEINDENASYNIELKFNIDKVNKAPQFVSPYNPSKYMSSSYEEFYYDNYLPLLTLSRNDLVMPEKNMYLQEINNTSPKSMINYQTIYYNGCKTSSKYTGNSKDIEFYKLANKLSKESINMFISKTELNIEKLNEYLSNTQNNKIYMLYKNGKFYKQIVDNNNYKINSYKKNKNKFVAKTYDGNTINILLRWKNGNGIAFPAFQIS
jgi:hypothetical protein